MVSKLLGRYVLDSADQENLYRRVMDVHLHLIHHARLRLIRELLPPGRQILDLGGANSPLYRMGYPHPFERLTLVDLPPEDRHTDWKDAVLDRLTDGGEVVLHYGDMTKLDGFADSSVDFVWSGQSIEHISLEQGREMCRQAFRVLRSGGSFCLDTPNRRITSIHTRDIGGGFIHPEHKHEYHVDELRRLVTDAGFTIRTAKGVCEMPFSRGGVFRYEDFALGKDISDDVEGSYIIYLHAIKP